MKQIDYKKYRSFLEQQQPKQDKCPYSDANIKVFVNPFLQDSTIKKAIGLKLISSGILDPKLQNYFVIGGF